MQMLPEFVRDEEDGGAPMRPAALAGLTGWETVIFQVVEEPGEEPEPESDSAFSTAAFAP